MIVAESGCLEYSSPEVLAEPCGARPIRRFWTIIFPLLSPTAFFLLVVNIVYVFFDTFGIIDSVTGGGPADRTNTLATMGIRYAFRQADFEAGIVTMVSAIPILIPLVILLTRRLSKAGGRQA